MMSVKDLYDCKKEHLLKPSPPNKDEIDKELNEAVIDLGKAKRSLDQGDHKWAVNQAYYSMFSAARAVLFSHGYKEKSHTCLLLFLASLADHGQLEMSYVNDFKGTMYLREKATYSSDYDEESARKAVDMAEKFIERMRLSVT
jgi:uncharacterized protein (UPF0332 family)